MNMNSYSCCDSQTSAHRQIISQLSLLKLIAEENRLKLLCILGQGEHCVCELIEHLRISQSLISHHLADLKKGDLVADEKRGLRVYYRLTPSGRNLLTLLKEL